MNKIGLRVSHTFRRVIVPCTILVKRGDNYNGQKMLIAYSPSTEGGNVSIRVACFVIQAAVQRRLVFFLLPFFSFSRALVFMQSF
jgi:hypothetical protein